MVVLVCGDRNWTQLDPIYKALSDFPEGTTVVHGGAKGADILGGRAATSLGFSVVIFPARWNEYGRAAGPLRNKQMLEHLVEARAAGEPVTALAFHPNLQESRGTKDMVRRLALAAIPYSLVAQ